MKLTSRQQEILDFIATTVREAGMPPTRVEIARHFGFQSINAAEQHLRALARKGAVELMPGTSRGIRLKQALGLPVVGQVAVQGPLLAEQNLLGSCPVSGALFKPKADFLLRMQGHALRDAGILDGDLLAVHAGAKPASDDLAVVRLDGELLVRRYQRKAGKVSLLAAHPDVPAIEVKHVLLVDGVVVGLLRGVDVSARLVSHGGRE
jgi:repressor LexA